MTLTELYKRKRILVTGHTGFKGSWLSIWLDLLGAQVIGYSLEPPSDPNNFEACGLSDKITHLHKDLLDFKSLLGVYNEYKPEIIFHLAAQPIVRRSYQQPRETYETNVMGTVNILEAARQSKSVKAIVTITSDKCYENKEWIWGYRENDSMGGHDPYSSSKGCAELVTSAYLRSFFSPETYGTDHQIALASVRAGNVIGGGDWGADRLIPDCARSLSRNEKIFIRYPNAIRPWQHVLEPLSGYLRLGARLLGDGASFSGAWNFGPVELEFWPVEKIVKEAINLWGDGSYQVDPSNRLHEANMLMLDSSKARLKLGWQPKYDVPNALKKTIEWYKKYYTGASKNEMLDLTTNQIQSYTML